MITVPGTLTIRSIPGRYGHFNVGNLLTEVGEFSVKDRLIEELAEGKYTGDFVIAQIKPSSYFASGRMVIEIRAFVDDMVLADDQSLSDEEKQLSTERDPLEDEESSTESLDSSPKADTDGKQSDVNDQGDALPSKDIDATAGSTECKQVENASEEKVSAPNDHGDSKVLAELKELFGELFFNEADQIKAPAILKTDPTVDRAMLRRQSATLGKLGYIHNYKKREWELKDPTQFEHFVSAA